MRLKPILLENGSRLTDVPKTNSREIQTNSLILAKNPQTNQPILALMKMVLDASKTNPKACIGCIPNHCRSVN